MNNKGPAYLAAAIVVWALLLWFFTINNPSIVPLARMIFIAFVIPLAVAEWLKMKGLIGEKRKVPLKPALILAGLAAWYFFYGR